MGIRVQIPAYTDRWMRGDRYGEVIKTTRKRRNFPQGAALILADNKGTYIEVHHVKLDKSGKVRPFVAFDCREIG